MGLFDFFKKNESLVESYEPQIIVDDVETAINYSKKITEQFKGEVEQNMKKFPVDLGEEHPFDFSMMEGIYKRFGFITGVIDKYVDFVVGPGFYVICEDERAKKIIEDFMQDVNFDTLLRSWIKEALVKGNGFLEIGGGKNEIPKGLKILNANYMYVVRDKFGNIEGYNQYTGGFKRFDKQKIIPFKEYQIAHIGFNKIGDNAYGLGIISPVLTTINNLLQNQKDMHMLMNRKANSPYDVKMGGIIGGKYYKPNPTDIVSFGKKLETLNNKHEWVHDGLTEIKVLDFGNIGDKFDSVLKYDVDMLFYALQVPAVIMGQANVAEGLAKVQMDAFERRVSSIQVEVEKVVENNIFKRVLLANGFDVHVEFEWGRPSSMEKYERLGKITELMKLPIISSTLTKLMEKDVVNILGYDEKEYELMTKEEEKEREENRPQPIVPGQNANPPQPVPTINQHLINQTKHTENICPHCIDIKEGQYNSIQEWLGFDYKQYIKKISNFIKGYSYEVLKATTNVELQAGMFNEVQIRNLKNVLEDGFKNGRSIKEIELAIKKKVKPKDLYKVEGGKILTNTTGIPILAKSKEHRPLAIARSEITRAANEGAVNHYKDEGIKEVRWVASFGERTCMECESLNGQVFDINEHPEIPLHTMCRCSLTPVTELG